MAKVPNAITKKEKKFDLTEDQFETLKRISEVFSDVSMTLEELKGSDDISSIMYDIGSCVNDINRCGDKLDNILDSFSYHKWIDEEQ